MKTAVKTPTATGIASVFSRKTLITAAILITLFLNKVKATTVSVTSELCEKIAKFSPSMPFGSWTAEDVKDYFRTLFYEKTQEQVALALDIPVAEVAKLHDELIATGIIVTKTPPTRKLTQAQMECLGTVVAGYLRSENVLEDLNADTETARATVATVTKTSNIQKWEVLELSTEIDSSISSPGFTDAILDYASRAQN